MAQRIHGYCTLCRSRCGSVTVVENGRMTAVEPSPGHPTGAALCAKGRAAPEMVHSPRRLTVPLRRTAPKGAADPGFVEIGWDEALDEVAARLGAVRETSGAEAVAFAVTTPSGTPMVDSSEWVERFIRCFGSPNIIYAVEVCGWHKDYAHALTFGRGIGFPDYEQADTIVLWGHNPARTWLAQATRIADAKRRGAKVAVIDPKPGGSGQLADLWLRVRPGADAALAMAAIRHLIATGTYDADFVTRWTNGPLLVDAASGRFLRANEVMEGGDGEAFCVLGEDGRPRAYDTRHALDGTVRLDAEAELPCLDGRVIRAETAFRLLRGAAEPYTAQHAAALAWLDVDSVRSFCALFENAPRLAYHSWTGVGQHTNATQIERAIATLYALAGACDREGGNVWAVPPPARTVNDISLLPPGQKEKALGLDRLPLGPPVKGWVTARDFAASVLEGKPYRARALMSWGTNFVGSQSDEARNRAVLAGLEFHVHADMFLNPTAECADIVLPANMPWEREALRIGFEVNQAAAETIQFREAMVPRLGQSKADYEIAFLLAERLGLGEHFFGGDIRAGWNHQLEPLGLTIEDVRAHPAGLRVPQGFRHEKYAIESDGAVRGFATPTRRAELYSQQLLDHGHPPLPGHVEPGESPLRPDADARFPLVLTTAKSGFFIHTSHRHVGSLRKKAPDPIVEISPALARGQGLVEGDWTLVATPGGEVRLRARINPALDDRVVVAEFGWWEDSPPVGRERSDQGAGPAANLNAVLSDLQSDPVSGSVPLRAITCAIRPDIRANRGTWSGRRDFRVVEARREAEDVVAFEFEPLDGGALPAFRPGQHVELSLPGEEHGRAYSLTGPGDAPERLSLGIRRQESGPGEPRSLSERLQDLRSGDEVMLSPPSGVFNPPLGGTRPLIFLAAGIGITPFLGHLETLARRPAGSGPPAIHLLHGCRHGGLHPFAERLAEIERRLPELRRVTAYSAPRPSDRPGRDYDHRGRIDVAALEKLLDARPLIYLCGSPGFVTETQAALVRIGFFAFDIMAEAFSSPAKVPAELAPQVVRLAGSDASFLWRPESGSLLDAAQEAGHALPSGCRVGQCESCAVTVVAGEVAHLGTADVEPGRCLACLAVPLSDVTLAI